MIIIQMSGGMGNQMFCYALYKALANKGKEVYIDDFTHYDEIDRHDNNLNEIFGLTYKRASRKEYNQLTDSSLLFFNRIRRKLFGRKEKVYTEKDAITFDQCVLQIDDVYLVGYWQSERYFDTIKDSLRKDFTFHWDCLSKKAKNFREMIMKANSISMHIRRGDYLNEKFYPIFGEICTDAYYEKAKAYFQNLYPDCTFFLFTNDTEWGKTQTGEKVVLVDCTDASNAYADMALMSCCKHHIIANSSFSWWGAWLNPNQDKTVVAPAKWLNNSNGINIYDGLCPILIDAEGNIQNHAPEEK